MLKLYKSLKDLKILVCGGRHFNQYKLLEYVLSSIIESDRYTNCKVEIVSGGCDGADKLGERFALENDLELKVFNADWKKYGKSAGPIRNKQMIDYINEFENKIVVAFVSPNSKGTRNTISLAKKLNIEVVEIEYELNELDSFTLFEGVTMNDSGDFVFDFDKDSNEDIIKIASIKTKESRFEGLPRFWGYSVRNVDGKDAFLKYMKDNLYVDDNVEELVDRCVDRFFVDCDIKDFDYIIKLPSSSKLNDVICSTLSSYSGAKIVCSNKIDAHSVEVDRDLVYSSCKYDEQGCEKLYKFICSCVSRAIVGDKFYIKCVPARYRKFIKSIIRLDNIRISKDSNVLIVDDVMTSGTTIRMMINELRNNGFVGTITIFNMINNR